MQCNLLITIIAYAVVLICMPPPLGSRLPLSPQYKYIVSHSESLQDSGRRTEAFVSVTIRSEVLSTTSLVGLAILLGT